MSLRARLTVLVALLVAAGIALTAWLSHRATEQELVAEVDDFLVDRVDQLESFDVVFRRFGRGGADDDVVSVPGRFGTDRFSRDDAVAQIVAADGTVVPLTDVLLPVRDADLDVFDGRKALFSTQTIEGTQYRTITAPVGRGDDVLVMVARDLGEVNGALDDLATRGAIIGLVGSALAALAAWVMASRLAAPVRRLTGAAEHVARTQDLESSIDVDSNDEVGRLAASFNTMLGALDTSRRQQQRLVMDASHELRTPLTSVRTNIDLLRRAPSIDAQTRGEMLDDVSREVDELTSLVGELVELATSAEPPTEPAAPVALDHLADTVAEVARRRHGRDIVVRTEAPATVSGHAALLQRALSNLVDNAVKFSPSDTSVDVSVVGRRVEVRDRGPGIALADRPLVFDRFFRSDAARTEPGSGLGLAIVADAVATHGGATFVDDPPDDGEGGVVVGFEVVGMDGRGLS